MNVKELRELLSDVDDDVEVSISIESGRSFSFSDDVSLVYDRKNKGLIFEGEESGYE